MKRILLACRLIAVILAGLFTFYCKGHERPTRLTIGTFSKAIDYSPFYVAKHFKWFEEQPQLSSLTVAYKEYNDRPSISADFDRGDLDVLFAAEPPAIICRAQGNDVRVIAVSCTLQQEIVVRSELPINSVPDLKGRTLAVLQGTSSHYGLLKILKHSALQPSDVTLRFMGPDQAKVAFETGQIDAWAVWPPFVEQQQVSGRGKVLTGGDAVIQSIMAIRTSLLTTQRPITRGLYSVIQRAKQWIQANPSEAQIIVADELGLDLAVVKVAWSKHKWTAQLSDDVIADIQEKAKFLADEGTLRRVVNIKSELIDTTLTTGKE